MNAFDLVMLPGDWWLGIWWIEVEGAHWLLLVRRGTVGEPTEATTWCCEERFRPSANAAWREGCQTLTTDEIGARAWALRRMHDVGLVLPFRHGFGLHLIQGTAAEFGRFLAAGEIYLPAWLNLLLVEQPTPDAAPAES